MKRRVVLLGATGSIGSQACDIIDRHPERFEVIGAVAGSDIVALSRVVERFHVPHIAIVNPPNNVGLPAGWGSGLDAACEVAAIDCEVVLCAIAGAAALRPALAAIDRGTDIALASKEVMVMAGGLVTARACATGSCFWPVDSEHSAIWQCLRGEDPANVARLILTASGGAFRDRDPATLGDVTPAEALRHPNWSMGPKVTIDSATMMNKGLEVIEAHFLFGTDYSKIDVVIHPQSLVHSMVEFCDGATMSQMGIPDMHLPIALALAGGARIDGTCGPVNWQNAAVCEFHGLDPHRFPAVDMARRAGEVGGAAPAILNAANEVAVRAFLDRRLRFDEIVPMVAATIDAGTGRPGATLDEIFDADAWARQKVATAIGARSGY